MYQSIHRLPLHIFEDCAVKAEFDKLIIEGKATIFELMDCFNELHNEYIMAIGGDKANARLDKALRIQSREFRIEMFRQLLDTIRLTPTRELFECLYHFRAYNPIRKEYSFENINLVLRGMVAEWKRDYVGLELIKEGMNKGEKPEFKEYTYEYFARIKAALMATLNVSITDSMSTGTFCALVVRYQLHCEALEKQNAKYVN